MSSSIGYLVILCSIVADVNGTRAESRAKWYLRSNTAQLRLTELELEAVEATERSSSSIPQRRHTRWPLYIALASKRESAAKIAPTGVITASESWNEAAHDSDASVEATTYNGLCSVRQARVTGARLVWYE